MQTVVRDLAVSASPMSLTTHVITTRPAERSGDLGALPITLHPLDYVRGGYRPIDRLRLAWGVARLVRRIRPDVVQLHSGIGWLGIVARFTAPRTPFVLEVHDAPGSGRHSHFTDMMEGWWVRRLGVTAICHSTSVRDEVRASWRPGEGKVVMFPLGVDTDLFSPIDHGERDRWRCEVGVQDSDVVVLAVGRIVESKRFGDAVEAVASADRLGTRVHLVVVGGGSETMEAELRDRAEELGVSDRVHLIGPRSRRALADAYGSADIVLSASGYEGFGLVVVEAMSAGVPVVATAVGGVTDLIDPDVTGLLVDVGDVGAMAMALQRLAEDDELRLRMGAAGRIRSLEKFSMGVATRNFVKTYRELARR
ncbi:MAG: glycosyltransferase family 4 protein [Ilumatobacter sp.]|uniref:glycosyltransferase family 4 protein n=1 Tax=Ilumatobacter sp. TaxID=1967498 RepID=UPI003299CDE9